MRIVWLCAFAVALQFLDCAKQAPPPGGPVDKIPPQVVAAYPPPDSTRVDVHTWVEITFSENVDRRSVEDAIFISPSVSGELKYRWKGKRLKIEFPDALRRNRTYVITLGTDVKDLRNNRMEESFTLAFSTGDSLDKGEVSGQVFSEGKVEGTLVWAYILEADSLPDPVEEPPDYITQCDNEGRFTLSYLAPGRYRLFAVMDKDRNRQYEKGYDGLGIGSADVVISPDSLRIEKRFFKIAVRDTTNLTLLSAIASDMHHLDLRFNKTIAKKGAETHANYQIVTIDSLPQDSLQVLTAYRDPQSFTSAHLVTAEQESGREYSLEVKNLFDLSGNEIDTTYNKATFSGSTEPDTIRPRIIAKSPKEKARNFSPWDKIDFVFSEAMAKNTLESTFILADSGGTVVAGEFQWPNPAQVQFIPRNKLESRMVYRIKIDPDSVTDLFGNALADTVADFTFTAVDWDTLSAISGKVEDQQQDAQGKIHLFAKQVRRGGRSYQIILGGPGEYAFNDILPGTYLIEGFRDADGNGRYSFGRAVPFIPAERFIVFPDSIKVRARWANEGNDLMILK